MAKRYEFGKPVKREALKRSENECEARGVRYGFPAGVRCCASLSKGTEFDHYPLPAYQPGSNTLENCVVCCPRCNQYANNKEDTPRAAKEKRIQDKHRGITKPKQKIPSRPFNQNYKSNTRQLREE